MVLLNRMMLFANLEQTLQKNVHVKTILFFLIVNVFFFYFDRMAPPTGEDMTGCGETRGCFRDPRDCLPGTSSCRFVSWVYVSVNLSSARDKCSILFENE